MKCLVELLNKEAKDYFLKGSSYFSNNMPKYIKFDTILCNVNSLLDGKYYRQNGRDLFGSPPSGLSDVNYNFATNKDGRFAWRPLELIHPAIYVSLVNLICEDSNMVLQKNSITLRISAKFQTSVSSIGFRRILKKELSILLILP